MDHLAHEAVEQLAALILVVGGGIFIAISARARLARNGSTALVIAGGPRTLARATGPVRRSLAVILAGLSAGAAMIHLAAAPSHYAEIGDLASGFVGAAIFQGLWIRWCLAGPGRRTAVVGIVGNVALVAAWIWTRTVGLPVGELAGTPEPVGFPDAASVVFELLLVAGLIVQRLTIGTAIRHRAMLHTAAAIAVVPVIGLVLVLTSLATVAIASGADHAEPAGHAMTGHVATP